MMPDYVLLKVQGHYLSLQDDEETIELTDLRDMATAFPVEVVPELEAAFKEHGIATELEQEKLSAEEVAELMAEEEAETE